MVVTTIIRRRYPNTFRRGRFIARRPFNRRLTNRGFAARLRPIIVRRPIYIRRGVNNIRNRPINQRKNNIVRSRTFVNSSLRGAQRINAMNIGKAPPPVIPKATHLTNDMPYAVQGSRPATAAAVSSDPFYQCRLSPFTAPGMGGIPDASESKKVMVDHRLMNTFTFGPSGSIEILVCPTIPSAVWFRDPTNGAGLQFNGTTLGTIRQGTYIPINLTEWNDQPISYNNSAQNYNEVELLYQASEMRFVSVGWSITPVSAAITTSGFVKITPVNFNFAEPVPAVGDLDVWSWNDVNNTDYNVNQMMLTYHTDTTTLNRGINRETRMFPFATGAHGILKHNGEQYNFRTIHHHHILPVTDTNESPIGPSVSVSTLDFEYQLPPTILTGAALSAWDNDWNATLINISGATAGTSFVLDNIYCIEYVPNPSGNVYALAQPSPPSKPVVLKAARDTANAEPIAKMGGVASLLQVASTAYDLGSKVVSSFST